MLVVPFSDTEQCRLGDAVVFLMVVGSSLVCLFLFCFQESFLYIVTFLYGVNATADTRLELPAFR